MLGTRVMISTLGKSSVHQRSDLRSFLTGHFSVAPPRQSSHKAHLSSHRRRQLAVFPPPEAAPLLPQPHSTHFQAQVHPRHKCLGQETQPGSPSKQPAVAPSTASPAKNFYSGTVVSCSPLAVCSKQPTCCRTPPGSVAQCHRPPPKSSTGGTIYCSLPACRPHQGRWRPYPEGFPGVWTRMSQDLRRHLITHAVTRSPTPSSSSGPQCWAPTRRRQGRRNIAENMLQEETLWSITNFELPWSSEA